MGRQIYSDNHIGQRVGVLTIVAPVLNRKNGAKLKHPASWVVECDCGKQKIVNSSSLRITLGIKWLSCSVNCKAKQYRLPSGESMKRVEFSVTRDNAKLRGLEFNLTLEQFDSIVTRPCNYCGIEYSKEVGDYRFGSKNQWKPHGTYKCCGIDRVDNDRGYVLDNCVPCCKICNYAKKGLTESQFKNHIAKIYHHFVVGREYALSA